MIISGIPLNQAIMALRAFIYLRAYGLRLATGIYGVCTQVNGKRCPHCIIQIMQSLTGALRTPGMALHNRALCGVKSKKEREQG